MRRSKEIRRKSKQFIRRAAPISRRAEVIDSRLFGDRVAEFLRARHPNKTAQHVEWATGIPAKTVSNWLAGHSSPAGHLYHQLISFYGAELVAHVDPDASHASLTDAARLARQSRLEREFEEMRAQLVALWSAP